MHPDITWQEICLRLACAFGAGMVIGANRGEHGRPAGLRTTTLVCLTAATSMILANILLDSTGKKHDSFVNFDPMRLPLGVLTGMGFIGAGAILHREDKVSGVTTAATLWFVTMMGFCFGSGAIALGAGLLLLGVIVLWAMEWLEAKWTKRRSGVLKVIIQGEGPSQEEIIKRLKVDGYFVANIASNYCVEPRQWDLLCDVYWHGSLMDVRIPDFVGDLSLRPGVRSVNWSPRMTA